MNIIGQYLFENSGHYFRDSSEQIGKIQVDNSGEYPLNLRRHLTMDICEHFILDSSGEY